ncbi:l-ascorbate oxidase-like protein [Hordeum vulgare]|nr:l-ascorbate oxidase-like protein [Hordeum vulgare]
MMLEFVMELHDVHRGRMHLPRPFARAMGATKPPVLWLRAYGCAHGAMQVYMEYPECRSMLLGRGWKAFARAHNLEDGHVLHFKPAEDNMLSVKFYRCSSVRLCCCGESSSGAKCPSSSNSDEEDSGDSGALGRSRSRGVKSEHDTPRSLNEFEISPRCTDPDKVPSARRGSKCLVWPLTCIKVASTRAQSDGVTSRVPLIGASAFYEDVGKRESCHTWLLVVPVAWYLLRLTSWPRVRRQPLLLPLIPLSWVSPVCCLHLRCLGHTVSGAALRWCAVSHLPAQRALTSQDWYVGTALGFPASTNGRVANTTGGLASGFPSLAINCPGSPSRSPTHPRYLMLLRSSSSSAAGARGGMPMADKTPGWLIIFLSGMVALLVGVSTLYCAIVHADHQDVAARTAALRGSRVHDD